MQTTEREIIFKPQGTCSRELKIILKGSKIHQVTFLGGCDGNLEAISRLAVGMDARQLIERLRGIDCGSRGTSCPDQLARALQFHL